MITKHSNGPKAQSHCKLQGHANYTSDIGVLPSFLPSSLSFPGFPSFSQWWIWDVMLGRGRRQSSTDGARIEVLNLPKAPRSSVQGVFPFPEEEGSPEIFF